MYWSRPGFSRWWLALAMMTAASCEDSQTGGGAPTTGATGTETVTSGAPLSQNGGAGPQTPASKKPHSPQGLQARIESGRSHYAKYCALCHGKDGEGYAADNAPSLISENFLKSASDSFIRRAIQLGRPDTPMAGYARRRGGPLGPKEINELIAFLRSKGPAYKPLPAWTPRGNEERGAALFSKECERCHGTSTKRGTAPWLHNKEFLATATGAFIRHAILEGRPPTPMQAYRGKLTDQNVEDIVTWLKQGTSQAPDPAQLPRLEVPKDLPLVIHPNGKAPAFTLKKQRFVSAAQVKQALAEGRRLVIVDARSPADWIQFHIPGSVPIGYYETEKLSRIPNDGTWVIAYCACPHHASGQVVDALRRKGYKNTAILDEGILYWKNQGYPLEGQSVDKQPKPDTSKKSPAKP